MRERNLKEPVTSQLITTIGVAEGNASRTIAALRFLDLLDEAGYITPNFRAIENATDGEYPEVLSEILNKAYEHVFMALEPATASEQQFKNAFLYYQPKTQRPRMIMLFKGLCREANIISGGAPEAISRPRPTSSKPGVSSNLAKKAQPKSDELSQLDHHHVSTPQASQSATGTSITSTQEYVIMHGVLQKLPFTKKAWTQAEREKWLRAVAANVDMLFELKDPDTEVEMEEDRYRP